MRTLLARFSCLLSLVAVLMVVYWHLRSLILLGMSGPGEELVWVPAPPPVFARSLAISLLAPLLYATAALLDRRVAWSHLGKACLLCNLICLLVVMAGWFVGWSVAHP
jgi:hypothetical protein